MPLKPDFSLITTEKSKIELLDKIKAECRTEVPTESVKEVLSVSYKSYILDYKVIDGKISYTGKATFFISYIDTEKEIKKSECGAEFTGAIASKEILSCDKIKLISNIEKCETNLNSVSLFVDAKITVKATEISFEGKNALTGGEDIIVDKEIVPVLKSYGEKTAYYPVEESIELSYPVKEVLDQKANAVITSCQCGVGVIIVDGEVYFSAILLQSKEKKDIIKESKKTAFRMEIECEDATPDCLSYATAIEKSFKTETVVDTEKGVSKINYSVNLSVLGEAFYTEELEVAKDCFSLTNEVETCKDRLLIKKGVSTVCIDKTVGGRVEISELPLGAYLSAIESGRVETVSVSKSDNGLKVCGYITFTLFFTENDIAYTRKCELPFEETLNVESESELSVTAISSFAKVLSSTETEIETTLKFTAICHEKKTVDIIKEVKCKGEKKTNKSAISVFIALPDEDIWSLAKRTNMSPESLTETNPELTFPLSGKERIAVYRKG